MNENQLWNKFLEEIKDKMSPISFETWFKDTYLYKIENNKAIVIVPMQLHKKNLKENYKDLISEIFNNITGTNFEFEFLMEDEIKKNEPVHTIEQGVPYNNPEQANLKPNYTFENFVVGTSNRFAYTAAVAVAENPGKAYNPLFLYGSSGLGKTHLMHAIGNYIVQNTNLRVLYITTDEFMNEFISITRDSGNKEDNFNYIDIFKEKYRDVDVLMIDDIQFLGSANATQQEFTNTFNSLYYKEKQIIICSDRSVDDLKMFADRLRTRFNWGLKAIISVPEFDLKVKIIKNKIKTSDLAIDLSEEIIDFMASNCGSDVRNLEGMITRLAAYSAICNIKNYTLETAMEALDEYVNGMGQYTVNSIGKIINIVSQYFKLTPDDLKGKKRSKDIANARMIAMYLCRILTDETYPRIGLEFGGRDHSTVIHAYEKINEDIKNNGELEKIISELKLKMSE